MCPVNYNHFTCIAVADGESMEGLGFFSGDLLLMTRDIDVKNPDVIVCDLNGEFLCKQVEGVVVSSVRLHRPINSMQAP
jgi:DNA polymerase V